MTDPVPALSPAPRKVNFGPFLAVLTILFLLVVAMFCTYLVVKGQLDGQAHALAVAQVKNSIGSCKALIVLDHAHDGVKFPAVNAAHPSEQALTKLFAGIHGVVQQSHCAELINLVKTKGVDGAVKVLQASGK
jgi:hypothetical protein